MGHLVTVNWKSSGLDASQEKMRTREWPTPHSPKSYGNSSQVLFRNGIQFSLRLYDHVRCVVVVLLDENACKAVRMFTWEKFPSHVQGWLFLNLREISSSRYLRERDYHWNKAYLRDEILSCEQWTSLRQEIYRWRSPKLTFLKISRSKLMTA